MKTLAERLRSAIAGIEERDSKLHEDLAKARARGMAGA